MEILLFIRFSWVNDEDPKSEYFSKFKIIVRTLQMYVYDRAKYNTNLIFVYSI